MNAAEVEREIVALKDETMAMLRAGKMEPDPIPWWWERRQENELTPDYLGRVLDEAGLPEMASRAREGKFDDYHDEDGLGLLRLVAELRVMARADSRLEGPRLAAIENAARRGEFDATKEESDRWAASKVGQETMQALADDERIEGIARKIADRAGLNRRRAGPKPGRNDPCPCGSGKKWKRCHGG